MTPETKAPTFDQWVAVAAVSDCAWLLRRRFRFLAISALLGFSIALVYIRFNPDVYVSTAQVRFIPPQVAERFVQPNVAMQVEQRIFALIQLVNSRLTAAKLIENFGLYPERRAIAPIADLTARFQRDLQLHQSASTSQDSKNTVPSILITFRYSDREKAQKVVQRVVELIYEENRRYRGDQSIGTTSFLDQQVKTALENLNILEEQVAGLPGTNMPQRDYVHEAQLERIRAAGISLNSVQYHYRNLTADRDLRKGRIEAIKVQLAGLDKFLEGQTAPSTYHGELARVELNNLKAKAEEAVRIYVSGHPDRERATKSYVEARDELIRQDQTERMAHREKLKQELTAQLSQMTAELAAAENSIETDLRQEADLLAQLRASSAKYDDSSSRELDRLARHREYTLAKEYYAELLKKRRESESASDMERRGQGESVELIEPPSLPNSAELPNFPMKCLTGLFSGFFGGYLVALFGFLRNPRVRTEEHVALYGDIQVLADLPGCGTFDTTKLSWLKAVFANSIIALILTLAAFGLSGCGRFEFRDKAALVKLGDQAAAKGEMNTAFIYYQKAIQKDALYGPAHFRFGLALLGSGQPQPARERILRAAELLPNDPIVQVRLAELTYELYFSDPGRPAALLRELEDTAGRVIEKWPANPNGPRLKALTLLERHRSAEAIALMERAVARLPYNSALSAQLASSCYSAGQAARAETILRDIMEKDTSYASAFDLLYLQLMERGQPARARQVLEFKAERLHSPEPYLQLAAHAHAIRDQAGVAGAFKRMESRFPADTTVAARIGDFWINRGDPERARPYFEAGQKNHTSSRALYTGRLVELELARQNRNGAREILERELRGNPNEPLLQAYQSAIDLDENSEQLRTQARARLESIANRMPNSAFVRMHLGRAYLQAGNLARAGEELSRCVTLDPNYAPGWVALARADLAAGNVTLAQDRVQSLLKRAPGYQPALLVQAEASLARQHPAEAEAAATSLLKASPDNVDALLVLGESQLAIHGPAEAIRTLERARRAAPGDPRPILLLTRARMVSGDRKGALALLKSAAESMPGDLRVRETLAEIALATGEEQLALGEYKKLVAARPDNTAYHLGYANLLGLAGKKDEAAREYKLAQASSRDPRPWLNYGALLASEGKIQEARDAYLEAIRRDKNNPFALNNLAYIMAKSGDDLQTALHYAQEAKRNFPKSPEINDTLAYIYVTLGMTRNAAAVFEETLGLQPPAQRDKTQRLLAQLRRGDTASVKKEMER